MRNLIQLFEQLPEWIWTHPVATGGGILGGLVAWGAIMATVLFLAGRRGWK